MYVGLCVQRHCYLLSERKVVLCRNPTAESKICRNSHHITDLSDPLPTWLSALWLDCPAHMSAFSLQQGRSSSSSRSCTPDVNTTCSVIWLKAQVDWSRQSRAQGALKPHRECTHLIYMIWLGVFKCYTDTGRQAGLPELKWARKACHSKKSHSYISHSLPHFLVITVFAVTLFSQILFWTELVFVF